MRHLIGLSLLLIAPSLRGQAAAIPDFYSAITTADVASLYGQGCQAGRNQSTLNFSESKKVLRTLFLSLKIRTLYCQCGLVLQENEFTVDSACSYQKNRRFPIVNWEHVVPASRFGQLRSCWRGADCNKRRGRHCCRIADPCFNRIEADLHNLHPVLSDLNYDRSNYLYGEIPGERRDYGSCDFEIDSKHRLAEPAPQIRGDIARMYLYMSWWYGFELTDAERNLFLEWNQFDPPDETERRLEAARRRLQGNGNPFISGWQAQAP